MAKTPTSKKASPAEEKKKKMAPARRWPRAKKARPASLATNDSAAGAAGDASGAGRGTA